MRPPVCLFWCIYTLFTVLIRFLICSFTSSGVSWPQLWDNVETARAVLPHAQRTRSGMASFSHTREYENYCALCEGRMRSPW